MIQHPEFRGLYIASGSSAVEKYWKLDLSEMLVRQPHAVVYGKL